MGWWGQDAAKLQSRVLRYENDTSAEYSQDEARRAVVHTREDVVLLVGHLDALNEQLSTIKWLLTVLLAVSILGFAANSV